MFGKQFSTALSGSDKLESAPAVGALVEGLANAVFIATVTAAADDLALLEARDGTLWVGIGYEGRLSRFDTKHGTGLELIESIDDLPEFLDVWNSHFSGVFEGGSRHRYEGGSSRRAPPSGLCCSR